MNMTTSWDNLFLQSNKSFSKKQCVGSTCPPSFWQTKRIKNLIVCHFWVSYLLFAHTKFKCFLRHWKNHVKYIPSDQNPPDWDHLRPPSDQLWTVLQSQWKIRLLICLLLRQIFQSHCHTGIKLFSHVRKSLSLSLESFYLSLSQIKSQLSSWTHCDLASFLTTFQNKTAAKQARGLGTAALYFSFKKEGFEAFDVVVNGLWPFFLYSSDLDLGESCRPLPNTPLEWITSQRESKKAVS